MHSTLFILLYLKMKKVQLQVVQCFNSDMVERQVLLADGKVIWSGYDLAMDCPEDAMLSRSMTNGMNIIQIMKQFEGCVFEILEDKEVNIEEFENFI